MTWAVILPFFHHLSHTGDPSDVQVSTRFRGIIKEARTFKPLPSVWVSTWWGNTGGEQPLAKTSLVSTNHETLDRERDREIVLVHARVNKVLELYLHKS